MDSGFNLLNLVAYKSPQLQEGGKCVTNCSKTYHCVRRPAGYLKIEYMYPETWHWSMINGCYSRDLLLSTQPLVVVPCMSAFKIMLRDFHEQA